MVRYCPVLLFIFIAFFTSHANGKVHNRPGNTFFLYSSAKQATLQAPADSTVVIHRKRKLFAALLAFPLGVFGLHRIYLGCPGRIPLVYVATLGGGFGILPFIDFMLILLCKDVNTYAYNSHLFMWSKKQPKAGK
jgi:TM2 domain-containing membrane protein YozV